MFQKRLKGKSGKNNKLSQRLLKENQNFEFAPIKISRKYKNIINFIFPHTKGVPTS